MEDMTMDFSNALTVQSKGVTKSKLSTLTDSYATHAKRVFLFDVSGSMTSYLPLPVEEMPFSYKWSDEKLAEIRTMVAVACGITAGDPPDFGSYTLNKLKLVADGSEDGTTYTLPESNEVLKQRVCQHDLCYVFGVEYDHENDRRKSRIDIVRSLARVEIESLKNKYPDSQIVVITFDGSQRVLFDSGRQSYETLWPVLEALPAHGGDTNILGAINKAITECRRDPSPIGLHHFILVTDGGADTYVLPEWIPALKTSGVVLDYIHVGNHEPNDEVKKTCEALGGSYAAVTSEKEFRAHFIEATQRKLLPPPEEK